MVKLVIILFIAILSISLFSFHVSAIPFIVGRVNDALDGTTANGRTVALWNQDLEMNDNVTDIIGTTGNSGVDNIYLIDCALLNNSCEVGMNISVKVLGNNGRITNYTTLTINGAGYQQASNLTLNSPFVLNYTFVDDSINVPFGEIDLTAGSTTQVVCQGVVYDLDGQNEILNVSSVFFDNVMSFYEDSDDNNRHYSNNSCSMDYNYGNSNEVYFSCTHEVWYYSSSNVWNCTNLLTEIWDYNITGYNTSFVNPLLAIEVPDTIDFGDTDPDSVSFERMVNVTNFGNVMINLSLEGYARTEGDNLSMNCSLGNNVDIPIEYQKFNLTASNPGLVTLNQFEGLYINLSSTRVVKKFDLNYRQNDNSPYIDDTSSTYWRIYAPSNVSGSCSGNIIFGAERNAGD